MDPVTVKFVQLILAEILGAALCIGGIYLFIRGLSGRSTLMLEGAGLKAKLTNGAPGSIIAIIGLVIIGLSLNSSVERTVRTSDSAATLANWLQNSYKVTDRMNYGQVTDTIVGSGPNVRFISKNVIPDADTTLGEEAKQQYGGAEFWHLLAAINKNRGYFRLAEATTQTKILRGKLIEAWQVSLYNGMDTETRIRVAGANRAAAYDDVLSRATHGEPFNPSALTDEFRARELDLAMSRADLSGVRSLRELALKYYGDTKYWPLIPWANATAFPGKGTEDTDPNKTSGSVYVIQFAG